MSHVTLAVGVLKYKKVYYIFRSEYGYTKSGFQTRMICDERPGIRKEVREEVKLTIKFSGHARSSKKSV